MLQLNPAPLDSQDFKIDTTNFKNKTLKNKKQVKFAQDENDNDNINRDNFNYNYNSLNKPNFNQNKKIKDLSNLISKLHNKDEGGEEINDTIDYTVYQDAYNMSNKFLDNTKIYSDTADNEIENDKYNKSISNINDFYNQDTDLMNYNNNYNASNNQFENTSNLSDEHKKYLEINKRILGKLDNILNLLEDQKSEKTGHVTEELILYVFLGIFIIYIIDSFARVGKYVR